MEGVGTVLKEWFITGGKDFVNYFLALLILNFSVYIASRVIKGIVEWIHEIGEKFNQTKLGQLTEIDDRFFKRLELAVEGMMPAVEDLKEKAADNKLTAEEMKEVKDKAWELFLKNLGVSDLKDFGKAFVGKGATGDKLKSILKEKFESLLPIAVERLKKAAKESLTLENLKKLGESPDTKK
jgi:hypothetical protein